MRWSPRRRVNARIVSVGLAQPLVTVDATIRIHDAVFRTDGHPSRADVVVASDGMATDQRIHFPGLIRLFEPGTGFGAAE